MLAVNPLAFLLSNEEGVKLTIEGHTKNISHLFFVDDLKLFARNMDKLKILLDLVTQFSTDIGMTFGESKCAYNIIERGKEILYEKQLKEEKENNIYQT